MLKATCADSSCYLFRILFPMNRLDKLYVEIQKTIFTKLIAKHYWTKLGWLNCHFFIANTWMHWESFNWDWYAGWVIWCSGFTEISFICCNFDGCKTTKVVLSMKVFRGFRSVGGFLMEVPGHTFPNIRFHRKTGCWFAIK